MTSLEIPVFLTISQVIEFFNKKERKAGRQLTNSQARCAHNPFQTTSIWLTDERKTETSGPPARGH